MEQVKMYKKDYKEKQHSMYEEALKNPDYTKLVKMLKLSEDDAKKNTLKLLECIEELANCKNCESLYDCKNHVKGYVYFPEKKESNISFSYTPCKYKKEADKLSKSKTTSESILDSARLKDIKITKNRSKIIKWLKEYYDNYNPYTTNKGLYLHGNFGTGKTFLIASLLNEIQNKFGVSVEKIYLQELLRKLKENMYLLEEKLYYLEHVDILFLDDIGAEKVTEWGRDEILGTILQTRMNKGLPTFFSSNLNISELERHLSTSKDQEEIVKAKRIIERIKFMTEDIELLGINYREKNE